MFRVYDGEVLVPLLIEESVPGRRGATLPELDVPEAPLPEGFVRQDLPLPELSELDVVRHFTRLSQLNWAIDIGFYPLGSCTMKYNPKVNEVVAAFPGFRDIHPNQDPETVQGALQILWEVQEMLAEIAGLPAVTLQPAAGAHGELTGMLIVAAYHRRRGETQRRKVLIPDSAHGTNPATAAMVGYEVVTVKSDERGNMDLQALEQATDETVAAIMLTNPNTLGLFEEHVLEMAQIVHARGGLIYCDGANMNALLGIAKPGHLGMDILHFNLHKTMSTPHGSGGPGAGATAVTAELEAYLPIPVAVRDPDGAYRLEADRPLSIGRVRAFQGNFGIIVRAWAFMRAHGAKGLREISETAVLNANYVLHRLRERYPPAFDRPPLHECVLTAKNQARRGARTLDVAKRLIDYGYHPPTIYFPLIVEEALMIEPTETESRQTLDGFCEALLRIDEEVEREPERLKGAPYKAPVRRLDETQAARKPNITWRMI